MIKKFAIGIATTSLFFASLTPAFGVTTVNVTENGDHSSNHVTVKNKCKTVVVQNNNVNSTINLAVIGNSGGNEIEHNTGVGATIDTGAVTNDVTISVTGGDNTATVPTCCCGEGEEGNSTDITLSLNGEGSHNSAKVKNKKKQVVKQKAKVKSTVNGFILGNSGGNEVEHNTGGTQGTTTNAVDNTVDLTVAGGGNNL